MHDYDKIFRPKTAAEIAEDMKRILPSYLGYQANPRSVIMAMFALQLQERDLMIQDLWNAYGNSNPPIEHLKQLDNLELCEPLYKDEPAKAPECECGKEKHGFASHASWCKKWNKES